MGKFSYESRAERVRADAVSFKGNRFDRIDSQDSLNRTVRYLQDGKLGTASGSKPDSEKELIEQAAELAKYGSPHDAEFAGRADMREMRLCDDARLSPEQMIEKAQGLVDSLRALDPRIVAGARLSSNFMEVELKTTEGFDAGYKKSVWSATASIELMRGEDLLAIYKGELSLSPGFDLGALKDRIAWTLERAMETVPFEAGAYPVIFSPGESGYIINPILASLNGMAIQRRVSPFTEKLGETAFDERLNIYDDATQDGSWASIPFDLEGTPTRRLDLVKDGRLSDIILNRKVGKQLGKPSTGNAKAQGPAANFVKIDGGAKPLEELIKSIDYGLLIDGSMGAWSGNPYAGIVTGTISMGLKIEKGKIAGRVKDCMYTVNAFEHFKKHLLELSSERDEAQTMFGSAASLPYIMLDEVVISAK